MGRVYRALANQWVPWDTNNIPPPPPDKTTVPLFGFATDDDDDWRGLSAAVGGLVVSRTYNPPGKGVPASYTASSASRDAARGATISSVSIRPDVADTAAGRLDAKITAFVQSCPPGTWVTFWAEADRIVDTHVNPAQFVAAWQRFYAVAHAANSLCFYGPCLMSYTWTTAASGYPPGQWLLTADGSFIDADFIGLDGYNNDTGPKWRTFRDVFSAPVTWIAARSDIPPAVMETGSVADPADGSRRGTWWDGVFDQAKAWRMPMVLGWQGSGVPKYKIYNPDDDAALAAIGRLNAASKER